MTVQEDNATIHYNRPTPIMVLSDERLSLAAKGLFCIYSFLSGASISERDYPPEIIKELIDSGYIKAEEVGNE